MNEVIGYLRVLKWGNEAWGSTPTEYVKPRVIRFEGVHSLGEYIDGLDYIVLN